MYFHAFMMKQRKRRSQKSQIMYCLYMQ